MLDIRSKKLARIFECFDFGYDVDIISSDDWREVSDIEYTKKVYLESMDNFNKYQHELYVKFFPSGAKEQYVYCLNEKGEKVGSSNLNDKD